ncbi:MAG: hypothetical protein HYW06_10955 [Gemmatimonadetes bacterium]|nr:hypothetical protein [Gemmatimonadota bacterium]
MQPRVTAVGAQPPEGLDAVRQPGEPGGIARGGERRCEVRQAPIWATAAFQTLGVGVPFYIAGLVVAVVGLLAFGVRPAHEVQAEAADG